ncbi:MAG: PASTA domain-containing protein [Clostridia bacterium]|nr:PASTA domain-containing protein [Clostridia bacterium]
MEKNLSYKDLVGTTLDSRYKIEKCLGTGGMSVVFKATDLRDGSAVAIKMLRDDVADDKESLNIFMNESKVVSMLSHPNIVSIRAVSFKTEKKYLVMEYIDGISLRTYMDKRGALDFDEFISFSEQILAALEHAHSRGVVHRDIKPQNILVLKDGFIKVTDFGIAKVPEKSKGKTISDNAIGTVYYISPEQAAGKSTDSRSDLYSCGVLMYEMATGRLPFDDERPISILMMQIHDKPLPPRKISKQIPRGLERLILTMMEKDPRRRYQTAKDVFIQIRRLGNNPLAAVPSPKQMAAEARSRRNRTERPPSRSFFPIVLGIACAVCFVGLVSVFYGLDALNFGAPGTASLKVPDSVGVEYSEEIITELGFNEEDYIVTVEYLTSNTVEKGIVISQKPSAGARRKSPCNVTISVSIGPELVTFGDYLMMNWRVAQTTLRSEGYGVTIIREKNAAIPEGYVYATEPMPGAKVEPGSMINVYVSAGTEQVLVTLPQFVGMTEREAKTFLDENYLLVGDVTYTRSPMKAGTIIYSSHEAGIGAYAYITAIDFVVSGGENFALNVCPDVIGKDAELSKKELERYGVDVNLITVRDEAPAGTVILQSPSAADAVASNTHSMTLTVSGGPTYTRTVNMMNLVGQSLSGARAILDYMFEGVCEYKLNVTYTMSLKPKDTILSQIPREGKVEISTGVLEITLVLSGGTTYTPPTVSVVVPNVTGMTLAEAEARLLAAGILISNISYAQSYAPAGNVIFQSATAGQVLTGPQGWLTIDLVVSTGYSSPTFP